MSMLGKKSEKYTFHIEVKKLVLKKASSLEANTLLNACLERGKHLLTTNDKTATVTKEGDYSISFNEVLNLDATLYKEKNGKYQDKAGKMMVRKMKKSFMSTSYQAIGSFEIKFNEILEESSRPYERVFLLKECAFPGSSLHLLIHISDENGNELEDTLTTDEASEKGTPSPPAPVAVPATAADRRPSTNTAPTPVASITKPSAPTAAAATAGATARNGSIAAPAPLPITTPAPTPAASSSHADPFGDSDPFSSAATATPGGGSALDDWAASQEASTFDWGAHSESPTPTKQRSASGSASVNSSAGKTNPFAPAVTGGGGGRDRQLSTDSASKSAPPSRAPPKIPTLPPAPAATSNANTDAQLAALQLKLEQAAQFIAYQDSQIKSFEQQQQQQQQQQQPQDEDSLPDAASFNAERSQKMGQVLVIQESKLNQAQEFIAYQQSEILKLTAQLEAATASSGAAGDVAELQLKVQQASEYIEYQDSQLAEANATIEALRASAATASGDVDVAELNTKLQQAAEYIDFQAQELDAARAELKAVRSGASAAGEGSADQAERLQQAADFITYQQSQIDELTEKLAAASAAVVALPAVGAGLVSSEDTIRTLETKLKASLEYIDALKLDLTTTEAELASTKEQLEVMVAYNNQSKTEANRPVSAPVNLLGGAAGEMESKLKLITHLREEVEAAKAAQKAAEDRCTMAMKVGATSEGIIAEMQSKLDQAQEYIAFQTSQLEAVGDSAELAEKVEQAKAYIEHQNEQLEALSGELAEANRQLIDLQAAKKVEDAQVAALKSELESVKAQLLTNAGTAHDAVAHERSDMQAKLDQAKVFIDYQTVQIEALKNQLAELTSQASVAPVGDGSTAKLAALEETVTAAKEFSAFQATQIDSLTKQLKEASLQLHEARDQLAAQETALVSLRAAETATAAAAAAVKQGDDQSKLQQAAEFIAFQESRIAELQSEIDAANAAAAQHADDATKLQQAADFIAYQSKQIEELTALDTSNETAVIKAEMADLSTKLRAASEFVTFQTNQITELTEAKIKSDAEVATLAELQLKLQQAQEFVAFQTSQINELSEAKEKLEMELVGAEELSKKVAQAAEFVAFQTSQLTEITEARDALVKEVKAQQTKLDQAKEYVAYVNKQLEEQTTELEALRAQLATTTAEVAAGKEKLATHEEVLSKLTQAAEYITYQTTEMAELSETVETQAKEIESLKAAVEAAAAAGSKTERKLRTSLSMVETHNVELSQLKRQLTTAEAGLAAATAQHEADVSAAKEAAQQQSQLEAYIAELEDKQTAAARTASEAAALKTEVGDLKKRLSDREGELSTLKASLLKNSSGAGAVSASLEATLKQTREQLAAKEAELAKFKAISAAGSGGGGGGGGQSGAESSKQIADLNAKVQQATAYIQSQKNQLEEASQTMAAMQDTIDRLEAEVAASSSQSGGAGEGDLAQKLQQAAEYINYQREQMVQLQHDLDKANHDCEELNGALLAAQSAASPNKKVNPFAPKTAAASPNAVTGADNRKELEAMAEAYQRTLMAVADKLLVLLPPSAAQGSRGAFDIRRTSPQEASQQLLGLTDSIVGYVKDGPASANGKADDGLTAKLAEKEEQYEQLLQNLIETKMKLALVSEDLDVQRKAAKLLRVQLEKSQQQRH